MPVFIALHRRPERPGNRLELCLGDVVRVAAAQQLDVQRDPGVVRNRLENVRRQRSAVLAADDCGGLGRRLTAADEVGAPGDIDDEIVTLLM